MDKQKELADEIQTFYLELCESQEDLSPEYMDLIYENLWNMYATDYDK
tara:strand:+ start:9564 stop:9707 length:144 start_codon:yes stop_codon:yes gene_type:complete